MLVKSFSVSVLSIQAGATWVSGLYFAVLFSDSVSLWVIVILFVSFVRQYRNIFLALIRILNR
jgi:hypothetical protein